MCCEEHGFLRESLFANDFIREYAFTNELKMMGHVWRRGDGLIIAAKGSPESTLTICSLTDEQISAAEAQVRSLCSQGLRVIAVAAGHPKN